MPVLTPDRALGAHRSATTSRSFSSSRIAPAAEYVLPMTHEETVTFHAQEISSYRQLPQMLYHFAIKKRDEPRSSGALLRLREFIMKDAYSFDRDEAGSTSRFRKNEEAYHRIFQRVRPRVLGRRRPSPGMMGGKESIDFLAPSGSGENTLVTCENGDFAADLEIARGSPARGGRSGHAATRRERSRRPASPRSRRSPRCSASTPRRHRRRCPCHARTAPRARPRSRRRPPLRVEDAGGARSDLRPATDEEIRAAFGAGGGSLGPVGVDDRGRRRRRASRGAVRRRREPRRLAPPWRRGRSRLRAALRRHSRVASRATPARSAAELSASRPRSRSGTSSSSGRATPSPSMRRSPTRTGSSGR